MPFDFLISYFNAVVVWNSFSLFFLIVVSGMELNVCNISGTEYQHLTFR